MVTVAQAVGVLFPNATPNIDYFVADDGTGAKIVKWNAALGTQPTPAQLAAVTQAQVDTALATKQNNAEPDLVAARDSATAAFNANATYIALAAPTAAQQTAQVKALSQQMQKVLKALARLSIKAL